MTIQVKWDGTYLTPTVDGRSYGGWYIRSIKEIIRKSLAQDRFQVYFDDIEVSGERMRILVNSLLRAVFAVEVDPTPSSLQFWRDSR